MKTIAASHHIFKELFPVTTKILVTGPVSSLTACSIITLGKSKDIVAASTSWRGARAELAAGTSVLVGTTTSAVRRGFRDWR